ncbi:ABC-type glycerol-3-phosphate transport system substrate-binding protein [Paenibacillus phyllosphaerae]|uniref:ABC-type glycerol-3-phosphate transport system substrate-binding protein n=1 Tax=Paenibacillus phyllosphaerae TaxID=274593 RepID=A0A7W5FR48_9BACL|nr:hypothetical protein [Paenibacillus phyllosphaerae]MBB3113684.1 ABC-type glycerol-3-phosphate transport system substrate-binding protein [Paenibacillus phyllosphaerae]
MKKRTTKLTSLLLLLMLAAVFLAGCGDEADLKIFAMPKEYMNTEVAVKVEEKLQAAFGETKKIEVFSSPMYNDQKLIVEIAAGGNGIILVPKDTLAMMSAQGPAVQLDDYFKAEDYPAGVMESLVEDEAGNEKQVKGLFAIPVDSLPIFKASGYAEEDILAFIPVNSPNKELSIEVLKELMKP